MIKILNIGCGQGSNIPKIINRGEVTCIDIEKNNIEISRKKFPNCNYIHVSGEDMLFDEGYFDEIYCFDVLEHVNDLGLVMKKIFNILKVDGILYIEVPFDKSEKLLLKINPEYFNQIGHNRIFEFKNIENIFSDYNFNVIYKGKSRGIVNIYLIILFYLKINITDQTCSIEPSKKIIERIIMGITIWFDSNLFTTKLKYIPLWIITLPIGYIITKIFPKTIVLKLNKKL